MEYTRNIVLDVNAVSASTVVRAKQGDNSTRFINITLTEDQVLVRPDADATAQFRLEKPDKKAILDSGVINADGTITIELTGQCTAVPGRGKADICIMKDGHCLSTATFILEVLASPDIANRALSSDSFGLLDEAIARSQEAEGDAREAITLAEEAIETANEASQYAIDNEPTATVTKSGKVTTLKVVDKNGTTTSSINDGYDPVVTVTEITQGHRVNITDAATPAGHSFDVLDGETAYDSARKAGYSGTESDFNDSLANMLTPAEYSLLAAKLNIT